MRQDSSWQGRACQGRRGQNRPCRSGKTRLGTAGFLVLLAAFSLSARQLDAGELFEFRYRAGDRYRIVSTITQDVFVDRRLSHTAEILNRIAVEIVSENGGSGLHRATFQTSEMAVLAETGRPGTARSGRNFVWSREYDSEFWRDRLGRMDVAPRFFMPVVRDLPVFRGGPVEIGDRWTSEGWEAHDFRDNFGIPEPYRIPFLAEYEFLGPRDWKGRTLQAFRVSYTLRLEPEPVRGSVVPRRITGNSDQLVFWDTEAGQTVAHREEFRYVFELSDGRTVEYRGLAEAEVVESVRMDRDELVREIAGQIEDLGIPEVSVRAVPEGVAISLDDIRFYADTAEMLPGEMEKIELIADILRRYPDRDILVGGHTALAGNAEGRLALSAERASVVAGRLLELGVRDRDRIVVRGYGAERPVAGNDTEEGRRLNRRVEITILEN